MKKVFYTIFITLALLNIFLISAFASWTELQVIKFEVKPDELEADIAIDSNGKVHIAYVNSGEIYYTNNTSGSFVPPANVSKNEKRDRSPSIAVDRTGKIHIVWASMTATKPKTVFEIYYVNGIPGSFTSPIQITNSRMWIGTVKRYMSIATDENGKIHIVWEAEGNIFYTNNVRGSFELPTKLSINPGFNRNPSFAIDKNGKIHVAWRGVPLSKEDRFGTLYYTNNISGPFTTPFDVSNDDIGKPVSGLDYFSSIVKAKHIWYGD